ncbi:45363_t:CDS:2 [Gigaspora margarita]|uniref:45363_t:CDS:1 n=1 Tax=Gigaspora margarita TaxID=4874 RepID=A0ABM8W5Z0_GIGMA|nr:45363_t:CDS:2 [Gigaspora margarita]
MTSDSNDIILQKKISFRDLKLPDLIPKNPNRLRPSEEESKEESKEENVMNFDAPVVDDRYSYFHMFQSF